MTFGQHLLLAAQITPPGRIRRGSLIQIKPPLSNIFQTISNRAVFQKRKKFLYEHLSIERCDIDLTFLLSAAASANAWSDAAANCR
jgi:hypothetical protein